MPQVQGAPSELNNLLETVYQNCISDGGSEQSCSKIAWDAAKNAGWEKDENDKWVKKGFWSAIVGSGYKISST